MSHPSASIAPTIPLVVQVGFAGSRTLFNAARRADVDFHDLDAQLLDALVAQLRRLPVMLGLSSHHFLCGVSQVAIGADTSFTRACQLLGIPQRLLLPRHRDEYLDAIGSNGTPDFTAEEQQVARELLESPHIIEERVVSYARDRSVGFEEANFEILRTSDVVVCLVREGADGKAGTEDLIDRAQALGTPVAKITVAVENGQVRLSPLKPLKEWLNGGAYVLPSVPSELAGCVIPPVGGDGNRPTAESVIAQIKAFASQRSKIHSGWFKRSAIIIIAFHLVATLLAILAGKFHESFVLIVLLFSELVFLTAGLGAHFLLHRSAAARVWAVTRLVAEAMRSLAEVEKLRGDLEYPLELAVPENLLPLFRTCAVLHLRRDRSADAAGWQARREAYVKRRLTDRNGQLAYFSAQTRDAEIKLNLATRLFWLCSFGAIVATAAELLLYAGWLPGRLEPIAPWAGVLAVVLPVAAVGFLSWAAAGDLEARAQTFAEMHAFLRRQLARLNAAGSEREFGRLVRETELRLLGETINWFSRRSFTSVT